MLCRLKGNDPRNNNGIPLKAQGVGVKMHATYLFDVMQKLSLAARYIVDCATFAEQFVAVANSSAGVMPGSVG
jgi:hypothetical protein